MFCVGVAAAAASRGVCGSKCGFEGITIFVSVAWALVTLKKLIQKHARRMKFYNFKLI